MLIILNNVKSKIVIGGKDHLLDCDLDKELKNYLRVRPDGYHRSDKFKKGLWDGWRYFITSANYVATGFVPYVINHALSLGAEVDIKDERGEIPRFEQYDDFLENGWTIRPNQMNAIKSIDQYIILPNGKEFYFPRGIIDGATNAGKNSIIAGVFNNLPHGSKCIMVVHNKKIYKQAVDFFGSMFKIGQVRTGYYKMGPFTIAMNKTLLNRAKESYNVKKDLKDFDVLIVDESHRAGSDSYAKLLQMIDAPIRLLVSGTPLDNKSKVRNMITVGLAGPILYEITNQELIEKKYSQKPTVRVYLNEHVGLPTWGYDEEMHNLIVNSKNRNNLIRKIVEEREGNKILISFNIIAHGYKIYEALKDLPYKIAVTHGEDNTSDFKIKDFRDGDTDVLIVSNILKEGANIHSIRTLINAQGGKSKITVKQISGRALRHDGVNDDVEIIDFYDIGKYLSPHSRKRIKIYKDEGFDLDIQYEHNRWFKPPNYTMY